MPTISGRVAPAVAATAFLEGLGPLADAFETALATLEYGVWPLVPKARPFTALSDAVRLRRFGTDCYAYCQLAAGRVDLVVMEHGGRARLLRNTTVNDHHWLGVRLRQDGPNARALGARVAVRTGDHRQVAQVGADGSYLSQHDTTLHFGLGPSATVDEIAIIWPDGAEQRLGNVIGDRVVTIDCQPDL